jgi:DNA-binding NarL/FixJ family response regulator
MIEVVLPGQNGALLAARLIERYPHMHILFTTDNDPRIVSLIEQQQQHSPGIAYLQRPYDAETLQQQVRNLFQQHPYTGRQTAGPAIAPDSLA